MPDLVIKEDLFKLRAMDLLTLIAISRHMDQDKVIKTKPSDFYRFFGEGAEIRSPEYRLSELKRVEYKGAPVIKILGRYHYKIVTDDIFWATEPQGEV